MKYVYYIKGLFTLKPVIIDGALCVTIAMLSYWESSLGKDEAFKYWNAYLLYFTKEFDGAILAGLIALNFFRSKSYADHRAAQENKQVIIAGDKTVTETTNENTPIVPNSRPTP